MSLLLKFFTGSNPEIRYMFSAIQDNKNVVLSLGMKSTYNAGSAYNQNVYAYQFQEKEILNVLKKAINGYYFYGFEGKTTAKRKYPEIYEMLVKYEEQEAARQNQN